MQQHYDSLEKMHLNSPINELIKSKINISQGKSEISFKNSTSMRSALDNIHNAYIFMALEAAAFFAANSLIEDVLVSTKSFEIIFSKPTNSEELIAKGTFEEKSMGNYIISAELFDLDEKLIAKAKGVFRRSKNLLEDIKNYQ